MTHAPDQSRALSAEATQLRRLVTVQTIVVSIVIAVGVLYLLSDVVLLVFGAALLACQLSGAAKFLSRHTRAPYSLMLTVVVLLLLASAGTFLWLRGPVLFFEGREVINETQTQAANLWASLGNEKWAQDAISHVEAYAHNVHIAGYAAGMVTSTIGSLGSLLLIVVAGIYFAVSPALYVAGALAIVPRAWSKETADILHKEASTLRWWFIGQLTDMAAIGILTGIGLYFLGVHLAATLALIAALCNFVPYIGALAGSVPAIFVAFSQSPQTALYVAILFVAVQTLEGNVISPLIQKRTVDLPPVLTLLSQTVLGTLFGPFGLILATPITAAGLVLIRTLRRDLSE